LGFCGRVGAETAGGPEEVARALEGFGERFGVAFQLVDDILDLVGSDGRSGKPEGGDAAGGKWTLPLILAAESSTEAGAELERALQGEISADDMRVARELAQASGAIESSWARAGEWLHAAREHLEVVPEGEAKRALVGLTGERFPAPVMG
jgi:geranylgeranyl pyrophosphate synthase